MLCLAQKGPNKDSITRMTLYSSRMATLLWPHGIQGASVTSPDSRQYVHALLTHSYSLITVRFASLDRVKVCKYTPIVILKAESYYKLSCADPFSPINFWPQCLEIGLNYMYVASLSLEDTSSGRGEAAPKRLVRHGFVRTRRSYLVQQVHSTRHR